MFVSELDDDVVLSRHSGDVGDRACAILIVHTLDLRLRGALHGQAKSSSTGVLGDDCEVGWLAGDTMAESGTIGSDKTTVDGVHVELEWTTCVLEVLVGKEKHT